MQSTFFFCLGKFLKWWAHHQSSFITKRSIYYIKHMYIQSFSMEVDWWEIWCQMEVSTMFYICTCCILTLWGSDTVVVPKGKKVGDWDIFLGVKILNNFSFDHSVPLILFSLFLFFMEEDIQNCNSRLNSSFIFKTISNPVINSQINFQIRFHQFQTFLKMEEYIFKVVVEGQGNLEKNVIVFTTLLLFSSYHSSWYCYLL